MVPVTAERFCELVIRSGLISGAEISAALEELKSTLSPGESLEARKIADFLVASGKLTLWQAEQILQGRYKGFFLKNYKLLSHLGAGGMSNVYVAEHLLMNRRVAIKVLPLGRVKDRAYLERFYQEARAAARVDHPNIVRAYDVENEGDVHFLVMEFIPGCDLATLVKREGPLDYRRAADYIRQAALGLAAAHRAGLVHRDIKPGNLLVDPQGVVKILDLGLALLTSANSSRASLTLESDDNVLGTADYIAPEQALNSHQVDARADIYSLGCSLYFLLTGHPPFDRGSVAYRLLAHIRQQPPSILNDRPDAPPQLVEICRRMMAKRPEDRPQTAEEVAALLEAFLREEEISGGKPRSSEAPTTPEDLQAATLVSAEKKQSPRMADSRSSSGNLFPETSGTGSGVMQKETHTGSAMRASGSAGKLAGQSGSAPRVGSSDRGLSPGSESDPVSHKVPESHLRPESLSAEVTPGGVRGPAAGAGNSGVLPHGLPGSLPRGKGSSAPKITRVASELASGAPDGAENVGVPDLARAGEVPREGPPGPIITPTIRPVVRKSRQPSSTKTNPFADLPPWVWAVIGGGTILAIILLILLLTRK